MDEHALRRRLFLVEHVRLQRARNAPLLFGVIELKPRVQLVHARVHKGLVRLLLGGGGHGTCVRTQTTPFFVELHTHAHTPTTGWVV